MVTFQNFKKADLLTILLLLFASPVFCQEKKDFEYLTICFKNSAIDSSSLEIKGIGNVQTIDLSSNEMEETGLTYYNIPQNKKNRSASKLSELASDRHIQTWKNNSRIILNEKYKIGETSLVDLRLHMVIENIYLQVIIICTKDKIYEIMCFRDTNDKSHFDNLIKNVKEQNCFGTL